MTKRPHLMIQGTGSHVGKTTLVAGLCRLFANQGLRVAPFKSQNMSLNSFVTEENEEIARATAVQSFAAKQRPIVHMNPLLLKPKSDSVSQLIIHGRPHQDVDAREYFLSDTHRALKLAAIQESIDHLNRHFDLVIAEGAGSCAEPNLRPFDVVNMEVAHRLDARVFVATDIDKGGVAAELLGTLKVLELVAPEDLERISGFIINKFRGDRQVLQPAIDFIEQHTKRPVAGVLPYLSLALEEEDRVQPRMQGAPEIDVAVVYLPHISNSTDFDYLQEEPNVRVRFVRSVDQLGAPDAVILPGTKNTVGDLLHLRRIGLDRVLHELSASTPIVGICGGFQMLGRELLDESRRESEHGSTTGLGLLDIDVEFLPGKTVVNRRFVPTGDNPFASAGEVSGYEIHSGLVRYASARPLYAYAGGVDGAVHERLPIFGTFIHDLFKNPRLSRAFIDLLRQRKGLPALTAPLCNHDTRREESYNRLAAALAEHLTIPD
ncbi:cobyric acid synthase [Myxococcus stipitatus]|uniref:cobyric acid synthase n=1 Tax=Myxococcus stipitatus TaxID=83455 RepID=UPI0031450A59